MSFQFEGDLDISKSWMNRALVVQSYQGEVEIEGKSSSEDVLLLKRSLEALKNGENEFYVGLGGTTFRFLALRLSREVGEFKIKAEEKLLSRPQEELISILSQLGVKSFFKDNQFVIQSEGWKKPVKGFVTVDSSKSSQFVSSIVLNSLLLPFDLLIQTPTITSESYFNYTVKLLSQWGLDLKVSKSTSLKISILKDQRLNQKKLYGEVDVSSFFSLASAALMNGDVRLTNWNPASLQPDMQFVDFFRRMNIQFSEDLNFFKIAAQKNYKSISADLSLCPDLFPVLAVVCAFAHGVSHLYGAQQLIYKETNRIEKTVELLERCGFQIVLKDDGLIIHGQPEAIYFKRDLIIFDPDHDHRMAFAAALLKLKGFPVMLTDMKVVKKSYPQFFQHIGIDEGVVIS
ncbi:MAG: 3-phosphoshikimate 1-carboxyvinyltransferase [Pseudobdellovibrio sp.]